MQTICKDRRQQAQSQSSAQGVSSVASDLDKLLGPKNLEELERLEKQINTKLASNEPIDTDYWEQLFKTLLTYKARAKLRKVSASIVASRLEGLRKQQAADAVALKSSLDARLHRGEASAEAANENGATDQEQQSGQRHSLDPEPLLRLKPEEKTLRSMSDEEFVRNLQQERQKVLQQGYVPSRMRSDELTGSNDEPSAKRLRTDRDHPAQPMGKDAVRGLGDNEELITTEEVVITKNIDQWSKTYRPRKPKYFSRVQLGFEWNKYNQTHYDYDNPPPRVVQAYKFNVFYPDLVDKTKAPTYRIERENGRKRGQTFAPAGEDDTCVIRFIAGPPYEDVAFRIVDKEWDFSAKRERGFKSSFDKVCYPASIIGGAAHVKSRMCSPGCATWICSSHRWGSQD